MRVKNWKSKILIVSLLGMLLAISTYSSLAYFTYTDTADNVITTGNISIEILEQKDDGQGNLTEFEDVVDVMPSMSVSKIVKVKNTSQQTVWLRVKVEKVIELAYQTDEEIDYSLIQLDFDDEYWTEVDGYYYYLAPLKATELTRALFTTVTFDGAMGNMYQDSKVKIIIKASAVQYANNGKTVFEAAGWPDEGSE
ncbi:MAG: SipW-dependent-type signal peptide-containing protein [Erysipelotrichaceae bacterium]